MDAKLPDITMLSSVPVFAGIGPPPDPDDPQPLEQARLTLSKIGLTNPKNVAILASQCTRGCREQIG
jgi:hypothetical protein